MTAPMSPGRFRLALAQLEPGEVAAVVVRDDGDAQAGALALLEVLHDEQDARPSLRALLVSGEAAGVPGCALALLAWTDGGPPPDVISELGPAGVLLLAPGDAGEGEPS